jgi:hypothetical protein
MKLTRIFVYALMLMGSLYGAYAEDLKSSPAVPNQNTGAKENANSWDRTVLAHRFRNRKRVVLKELTDTLAFLRTIKDRRDIQQSGIPVSANRLILAKQLLENRGVDLETLKTYVWGADPLMGGLINFEAWFKDNEHLDEVEWRESISRLLIQLDIYWLRARSVRTTAELLVDPASRGRNVFDANLLRWVGDYRAKREQLAMAQKRFRELLPQDRNDLAQIYFWTNREDVEKAHDAMLALSSPLAKGEEELNRISRARSIDAFAEFTLLSLGQSKVISIEPNEMFSEAFPVRQGGGESFRNSPERANFVLTGQGQLI